MFVQEFEVQQTMLSLSILYHMETFLDLNENKEIDVKIMIIKNPVTSYFVCFCILYVFEK